jgi:hypothetical protein
MNAGLGHLKWREPHAGRPARTVFRGIRAKTCSFEARDERESRCASVHAHTFSCWGGHGFLSKGEDSEVGEHSAQRANMPAPAPRTC